MGGVAVLDWVGIVWETGVGCGLGFGKIVGGSGFFSG